MIFSQDAMIIDILCHTPDPIAAHRPLRAIGIIHDHPAVRRLRRSNTDKSVCTDAKMPITDHLRDLCLILQFLLEKIHVYIVVPSTVHFSK